MPFSASCLLSRRALMSGIAGSALIGAADRAMAQTPAAVPQASTVPQPRL
jgi:hypothetical protein